MADTAIDGIVHSTAGSTVWDARVAITSVDVPYTPSTFGLQIIDWDGYYRTALDCSVKDLFIPFQYIEKIPIWRKSAKYAEETEVLGRFEGISIYTGAQSQTFELVLKYVADSLYRDDYEIDGVSVAGSQSPWALDAVLMYVKRLQSLVYPVYDEHFSPPPKCKLNIGTAYQEVPIIITDISVEDSPPYNIRTGEALTYDIMLSCKTSYPMWQTQSFASIYSTSILETDNGIFAYQNLSLDKLSE